MKPRLLAFVLLLSTFAAKAQYVTIPDSNFVAFLTANYPNCMQGNQMDTTCSSIVLEYDIDCGGDSIYSLEGIQYFDKLRVLFCYDNNLSSLPPLPPLLESLYCDRNNLTALPTLPSTLKSLNFAENQVLSMPVLPAGLVHLVCANNNIASLPILPSGLKYFDCSSTSITTLPLLPNTLQTVVLSNNNIISIPILPDSLKSLNVDDCSLTSLPTLPLGIRDLICNNNLLAQLPNLPATLIMLSCKLNPISVLPSLPPSLEKLYITDVPLTVFPALPINLRWLTCGGDYLTYISELPNSLERLYCMNSPNLKCLPKLKDLEILNFSNTGVQCLPNYPLIQLCIPQLDSLPICDIFNENNCVVYGNITGRVYYDSIANCVSELVEPAFQNITSMMLQNAVLKQATITNEQGLFNLYGEIENSYHIVLDTNSLPFTVSCPQTGFYLDTIIGSQFVIYNNFALRCKTGFDLAAHSISTGQIFRPANNTEVNIQAGDLANFYNANCAHGVAGAVTVTINGPATYLAPASGATAPSNVSGNVITWNVADFGTANALTDFNIIVRTDTFAQIGAQACFTVRVTPTVGDNDSSNNTLTYCFPIVNSYDPNDKTAYPGGDIDTAQEWLTYRVRFQNTGNAEAQHIYIMDTLDTDVNASTFQLLAYSHQPNVQINESIVRFNFPNINLPDSFSNEPGSHGYVQYKVKLKENLPIGTTIQNTAFIYFDFNPPVVTNTTTSTIAVVQDTTGVGIKQVNALTMNIYPNPANGQVTITTSQANNTIYMYTAQGQLLSTQAMQGTAATLNIEALPSGIYYIEVSGTKGTVRKKLVKL